MNLRDLRYAVAVADHGRFGKAAEICHVSQPTLSGQILKLEEELGVAIFERIGKQVRITPAGAEILRHARRALAATGDIVAAARAASDPLQGPIRLGVIPTIAPYLAPYALPAAASALPHAPLAITEDFTHRLMPLLADGAIDAAIIATDAGSERLATLSLYDEPFFLVAPAGHALAARDEISVRDIDPAALLLLTDGHCLREQTLELCGATPSPGAMDVRAASLETLLQLTAANYGLTLAPALAAAQMGSQRPLVARRIADAGAHRRVRLAHRRDTPRQRALERLAAAIRDSLSAVASATGLTIGDADHC